MFNLQLLQEVVSCNLRVGGAGGGGSSSMGCSKFLYNTQVFCPT